MAFITMRVMGCGDSFVMTFKRISDHTRPILFLARHCPQDLKKSLTEYHCPNYHNHSNRQSV